MTSIFIEKGISINVSIQTKSFQERSQETKDHLAIDKEVMSNCRKRMAKLCMAYVDFKMAYDKVPHSRLLKCLQVFRVADEVINIMESSMAQWKTHLSVGIKRFGSMSIRRRILQGDSFSPLLFVITKIPLSMILRETGSGYAIL